MSFEKDIGGNSSVVDILRGCSCNCGCGKCNSKNNPTASNDNGGSDTSRDHYNASQGS